MRTKSAMDGARESTARFGLLRRYPVQRLSREQWQGMANTMAASFFLGWAPILGKLAYRYGVSPFTLAALRTVMAALLLWIAFVLFWRREIKLSWPGLIGCVSVGAVNGFGSLLYYTSLARLDASLASLLNTLYPLWVALFLFASGQPLSSLTLLRLGLAMGGVFLLTWGVTGEPDWLGVTLMIASAATYGWHLVLGQWVMADVPPRTGTLYILTSMACVVSLARIIQSPVHRIVIEPIADRGWYAIIALGVTTALSRLAVFSALRKVGGVETSIGGLLELVVSLVLAFVLLGERMTVWQWVGGVLLIFGMLLMAKDPGVLLAQGNEPVEWKRGA